MKTIGAPIRIRNWRKGAIINIERIELVLLKNVCEKYLIVLAISMPDGGGRTLCNNRI